MGTEQTLYTVRRLAALSGVSIRTLHHYDAMGLLVPSQRSEKRYRLYDRNDLLRLQQILFYRTLGYPLREIARVLDDPDFDLAASLRSHRELLAMEQGRLSVLLHTIERTLNDIEKGTTMVTDKELYDGFTPEQASEYKEEAEMRWGKERVAESEGRVRALTKEQWRGYKERSDALHRRLAVLMTKDPADAEVQQAVEEHRRSIEFFYDVTEEIYRGLAAMYVQDPRFTATYEAYAPGLAQFLSRAMLIYCENGMQVR